MMENDYTTVSSHPIDGWLGFFVGTELWYPLFQVIIIIICIRLLFKL